MSDAASLPDYSAELDAFHRAHRQELQNIIADLELSVDDRVLDVACGDGCYTHWLAERTGHGLVVGVDQSLPYLQLAQARSSSNTAYVAASIERLSLLPESCDLAFCAQSLVSLPDPLSALNEMLRVLRPGGRAAVMENDSLHELILPWPEDLELAIRAAQWNAYCATKQSPEKRYAGRRLSAWMRDAGFTQVSRKTYSTDRVAPLRESEKKFLLCHLTTLRSTVWEFLCEADRARFDRLVSSESPDFLLAQQDFEMTWLDVVCIGSKPVSA